MVLCIVAPGATSNFPTDKILILFWSLNLFSPEILDDNIVNLSWKNDKFVQSFSKHFSQDLRLHFLGIKVSWLCWINLSGYVLYLHAFLQRAYGGQMGEDTLNILHHKILSIPATLQPIKFWFYVENICHNFCYMSSISSPGIQKKKSKISQRISTQ